MDSSVWIDHFRRPEPDLIALLELGDALLHPFVMGEIALGQLKRRSEVLRDLAELESVPKAEDEEVMGFIERFRLTGSGIGWVDCHLLAAARLDGAELLTRDHSLKSAWNRVKR